MPTRNRSGFKSPIAWVLRWRFLRERLAFALRHAYYADLDIRVPLGRGLVCPISSDEHWCSFAEIFFEDEYGNLRNQISLPSRWIDLGCHAGFFSLWLAWRYAGEARAGEFQALLVDADARVAPAVGRMIAANQLANQLRFRHGAISARAGTVPFYQRGFMSSSSTPGAGAAMRVDSPVFTAADLLANFPPPYDLIKVDIEGAEVDFIASYSSVLEATRHLLIEWHSWQTGDAQQIVEICRKAGFRPAAEITAAHDVSLDGKKYQVGTWLFARESMPPNHRSPGLHAS